MNFVLPESLGGGGVASLRSDPQVIIIIQNNRLKLISLDSVILMDSNFLRIIKNCIFMNIRFLGFSKVCIKT